METWRPGPCLSVTGFFHHEGHQEHEAARRRIGASHRRLPAGLGRSCGVCVMLRTDFPRKSASSMKSQAPRSVLKPATLLGLFLALVVPTLPPVIDSVFFGTAETSARVVWGTVVHWANFAALIAVVLLVEHQRLTSIGLRP